MELLAFMNRAGAIAVSFDDGENLVLPNGRRLPAMSAWEEMGEIGVQDLSEPQRDAIDAEALRLESLEKSDALQAAEDAERAAADLAAKELAEKQWAAGAPARAARAKRAMKRDIRILQGIADRLLR
jgi:hypothetical protein